MILAHAYLEAIRTTQRAASELIETTRDENSFRFLLAAICSLHGQAALGTILHDLDTERLTKHLEAWSSRATRSPRQWRRHLAVLRASGWRDEDIVFGVEALKSEDERDALIYESWDVALAGLRALSPTAAPAGWFERTGLLDRSGELPFRALVSIAWLTQSVELSTMLREPT